MKQILDISEIHFITITIEIIITKAPILATFLGMSF